MSISASQIDRLRHLDSHLQAAIKGQDHVIQRVCSVLKRGELGLSNPGRPKGSFLFVGPTGVGKTEITLSFSDYLFGPGNVHRFDMSEFQNQSSVGLLLGASSTESGLLGRALAKNNYGVLLFDEMEKAHPLVLDLFLQMLDAGRITLSNGDTKDLSGYYLVLTSNVGAAEAIERTVLKRLDQTLRPELVARINEKIVFSRLSFDVQRQICEGMIQKEQRRLESLGYHIHVTREITEDLIREGFHRTLGARPMRSVVERRLQDMIVAAMIAEPVSK
jgi:ATP-dependent Clp protease ATP-binding subunit ClpB